MNKFLFFFFALIFLLAIAFSPVWEKPALAVETKSIPTVAYSNGNQQVLAPDWSRLTWSSLPPIQESGGWTELPSGLSQQLGFDPSVSWQVGETPDRFIKLGSDVQDAFHLEAFSLQDISDLTGLAMQNLRLNDFGLTSWQTPNSLVKAIPELGSLNLSDVQPLQDLAVKSGEGNGYSGTIADFIQQNPTFADTPLSQLNLKQYSLGSIPGISQIPLGQFRQWQQSLISEVPGLNQVPFSQFPVPLVFSGLSLAKTDITWGSAEHGDPNVDSSYFVSGSVNQRGQTVPVACPTGHSCPYLELSDPLGPSGPLHGKRWVSGEQQVDGGFGPLAILNGGKEPAGRTVFGADFGKIVVENIDESKASADFSLYKRICAHYPLIGKSCSPFFIPIPLPFSTREGELIIVSALTAPNITIPQKYQERIAQIEAQNQPTDRTQVSSSTSTSGVNGKLQADTQGGESDAKIVTAINNVGDFSTADVPNTDGGNNACMWAVNHVLENAGYQPLADGTLSVLEGKAALDNGRGQKIDIADAKPGDLVLVDAGGSHQHIGFCETNGCTRTISNSSSQAQFDWQSNANFSYDGSPYNGTTPQVYRLIK